MLTTIKAINQKVNALESGEFIVDKGLYIKISSKGNAAWVYRYTLNGRRRRLGLGAYPLVSLAEARALKNEQERLVFQRIDPIAEKRRQRSTTTAATFAELAHDYIEASKPAWKNSKNESQWRSSLRTYAFPVIGQLHPQDIDTHHLIAILQPIWLEKAETARRVRNRIELIIDSAKAKGVFSGDNPARYKGHLDKLLPKRKREVTHHNALPYAEVGAFVRELEQHDSVTFKAMIFTILTACRTSEVLNAQWREVDIDSKVWTVPAERMKAGKEHRVPLTPRCIRLLQGIPRVDNNPYIFAGLKPNKPLSNMAMLMGLRKIGRDDLTMHGFRSTFRDWASECTNHPRDVAEIALAHTISSNVEAAYRRGDLFTKRRDLMNDWESYINQN